MSELCSTRNKDDLSNRCLGSCVDGSDLKTNKMAEHENLKCHFDGLDIQDGDDGVCGKGGNSKRGDTFAKFADPSTITPPSSLSELIRRLHEVFANDDICVEYVQKLMTSYKSNPAEWKKFAKFDEYKYTRNLVDEGNGKFNLMILCWNEAQGSSIHSHADSHCFLKVLNGAVKEELFHWPEDENKTTEIDDNGDDNNSVVKKKGEMNFDTNECGYINDSLGLHRVENESHVNKAVTLHLYSPPFQECSCFDQRSGRVTTAQMTFWSKFGKRTPYGKNPEKNELPVENN